VVPRGSGGHSGKRARRSHVAYYCFGFSGARADGLFVGRQVKAGSLVSAVVALRCRDCHHVRHSGFRSRPDENAHLHFPVDGVAPVLSFLCAAVCPHRLGYRKPRRESHLRRNVDPAHVSGSGGYSTDVRLVALARRTSRNVFCLDRAHGDDGFHRGSVGQLCSLDQVHGRSKRARTTPPGGI